MKIIFALTLLTFSNIGRGATSITVECRDPDFVVEASVNDNGEEMVFVSGERIIRSSIGLDASGKIVQIEVSRSQDKFMLLNSRGRSWGAIYSSPTTYPYALLDCFER